MTAIKAGFEVAYKRHASIKRRGRLLEDLRDSVFLFHSDYPVCFYGLLPDTNN